MATAVSTVAVHNVLKTVVGVADELNWTDALLSNQLNVPVLKVYAPFSVVKKIFANIKRNVDNDDDDRYLMNLSLNGKEMKAQFAKSLVGSDNLRIHTVNDKAYLPIQEALTNMFTHKLFVDNTEPLTLEQMKEILADMPTQEQPQFHTDGDEEKHSESKDEKDVKQYAFEAQDEMMNMLEGALGNISKLLEKRVKEQMTFSAIKTLIVSVVKTTLMAAGINDVEVEQKVMAEIVAQGLLPKPTERKGALSGYTLFTKEKHAEFKENDSYKGKKPIELTKEIGAMWKALSDEEKQKYNERAGKENAANPNKASKKSSRKGSRKSTKSDGPKHTCAFVMTKGERMGQPCGSTVRGEEPNQDGQWLCTKHTTAEKKKAERAESKKSEKKKSKKTEKKEEEEEEEKPKKKTKKVEKKEEEEEEVEKPKKTKKVEKKEEEQEEEKPKKVKQVEKKEEKKTSNKKEEKKDWTQEDFDKYIKELNVIDADIEDEVLKGHMESTDIMNAFDKIKIEDEGVYRIELNCSQSSIILCVFEDEDDDCKYKQSIKVAELDSTNKMKLFHTYFRKNYSD